MLQLMLLSVFVFACFAVATFAVATFAVDVADIVDVVISLVLLLPASWWPSLLWHELR